MPESPGKWGEGEVWGRKCLEGRRRPGRTLLGPVALTQASDGSLFWERRVGGVIGAELMGRLGGRVGRGPGHLVRSPDERRGGWGHGCVREYRVEVGEVEGMRLDPG